MKIRYICALLVCCLTACQAVDTLPVETGDTTTDPIASVDVIVTTESVTPDPAEEFLQNFEQKYPDLTIADYTLGKAENAPICLAAVALHKSDDSFAALFVMDGSGVAQRVELVLAQRATYSRWDSLGLQGSTVQCNLDLWSDLETVEGGRVITHALAVSIDVKEAEQDGVYGIVLTNTTGEPTPYEHRSQITSDYADYYFSTQTTGYGKMELAEISTADFAKLSQTYPVYIDRYPADHGGMMYDTGAAYQQKCADSLKAFLSQWQGAVYTVDEDAIGFETDHAAYPYNDDINISARPWYISAWIENPTAYIHVTDIDKVMEDDLVAAMLQFAGITHPTVEIEEEQIGEGDTKYSYTIQNDPARTEVDLSEHAYVTVSGTKQGSYASVSATKYTDEVYQGAYTTVSPEAILADLRAQYEQEIPAFKYSVFHSDVDFFGYSIPCYAIFVPTGGENDGYDVHFYRMCLIGA